MAPKPASQMSLEAVPCKGVSVWDLAAPWAVFLEADVAMETPYFLGLIL
jgi:hypothetical protein